MAISLASIAKHQSKPPRIVVYGDAGIGKTSFAVGAPNPIVLQTEDGLGVMSPDAFPLATGLADVMEALAALYSEEHDYQTLVVDSLDWLEPLIWAQVCADHNKSSIEEFGYGKGYVEANSYWRRFFQAVTALRDEKNMIVIMTAHSHVVRVEDPTLEAYDAHAFKLHKRASALAEEYSDVILYACMATMVSQEDLGFNQKRTRARTTGERIARTTGTPAYTAKSRFPLPDPISLSWDAFAAALSGNNPTNQQAA